MGADRELARTRRRYRFVAGLLGIGGGIIMVPFLTLIFAARGYPEQHLVHMAVATSLARILFTSVSWVPAHDQHGAVLWRVVRILTPGIVVGSLIGAQRAGRLPTVWLALIHAGGTRFSDRRRWHWRLCAGGKRRSRDARRHARILYPPALLTTALASVLTAPLGARTAHALNTKPLKRTFSLLLFMLAGYMLYRGLKAS